MENLPIMKVKNILKVSCVSGLMMCGTTLIAQEAPKVPLQPDQRAKVQAVGQSLIQAMRTVKPAQAREAVVDQIKAIKQQVDAMAALDTSSSISLQSQSTPQSLSALRQDKVDTAMSILRSRLAGLKTQVQDLRHQQQTEAPTLWQRVTRLFGQTGTPTDSQRLLVKPLSIKALIALDTLDTEVENAMALPTQERRKRFKALSQQLTLSKNPVPPEDATVSSEITMDGEVFTVSSEDTPTFQIRTQHRRHFSVNN